MNDLRSAFEGLAYGLLRPVFSFAVRLTGNTEDGIDLTREAFIRAYIQFVSRRSIGPFRLWLYQVLLEVYRETRPTSSGSPPWRELSTTAEWFEQQFREPEKPEFFPRPLRSPVESALQGLPDDLRMAFLLGDVEKFSYSQIAKIVGRSRMTVAGRIFQARWMLRASLRKQPPHRPPIER